MTDFLCVRLSNALTAICIGAAVLVHAPSTRAGSGHEHAHDDATAVQKATSAPHLSARSESYQLVGNLDDGSLTILLNRIPDGSPVTGARIDLTIDDENGVAVSQDDGTYLYRLKQARAKKVSEVVAAISEGDRNDLLIGVLKTGQNKSGASKQHDRGKTSADTSNEAHGAHESHGSHGDGHSSHDAEGTVRLDPEVMQEFGVATDTAGPGILADSITRPAEVSFNMDRFTHVVPRVAGIAKSVNASEGDNVTKGQILAEIESRELAELKAAYLAAIERIGLAKDDYERLTELRKKKITSEKSYLTSRAAYSEARIVLRSAKQKLNSIGIDDATLDEISKEPDSILTQYTLGAPMGGIIVNRHLVQGELVTSEREAFRIADTASVWINISVYSSDLPKVHAGQKVTLQTEAGATAEGTIMFVTPDVSEQTRRATARVVLEGVSQTFRPGMFIKAIIDISESKVAIRVPKSAIHTQDGKTVVFARKGEDFKPRPIEIGRQNARYAEVVAGLAPGEVYAAKGAFLIKSQLSKSSFGDGHNH